MEETMKTHAVTASALVLATATPALASSGSKEGFSGVFIWVFLGYCAIIVVAQTAAAIRSLIGMAKGTARGSETETQEG